MNKGLLTIGGITIFIIVGSIALVSRQGTNGQMKKLSASFQGDDAETISDSGVHWHPELAIYIKGQKQEISKDIGIGVSFSNNPFYDSMMQMTDIHTHDNSGVLHWEVMSGPVKKGHVKLKAFFGIWGKTFNSNQIFDYKNGDGGTVKMTVNGNPNTEFENYIVKDKDKIEISFE